jgi:glycosyltransferase involved in cell wall biosynthesis
MRVLHLDSSSSWGGGQNQVRLLMRELSKAGVDQLCICPKHSPLAERLARAGLPVREIIWKGGADPRALWSITRIITDYDVVHCHDAHALQQAVLPAKLIGKKIIAARRVPFKTSAFKWNLADRVVAVSNTVREILLKSGIDPWRVRVIHSGTDLQETRSVDSLQPPMREQLKLPSGAFVIGNAAVFIAAKGQLGIPPAAQLLPDVHWFIAGDGPLRTQLEAAIANYRVGDRVHLLGWLPDARQVLKEVDAYVSTSTEDGLGNSVTESLALRVPVLSADASGGAEIVRPVHERTQAALFEPGNPQSLADAVQKLRQPGMREKIIAAQDERFADFAIERTAAATLELYEEVVRRA